MKIFVVIYRNFRDVHEQVRKVFMARDFDTAYNRAKTNIAYGQRITKIWEQEIEVEIVRDIED